MWQGKAEQVPCASGTQYVDVRNATEVGPPRAAGSPAPQRGAPHRVAQHVGLGVSQPAVHLPEPGGLVHCRDRGFSAGIGGQQGPWLRAAQGWRCRRPFHACPCTLATHPDAAALPRCQLQSACSRTARRTTHRPSAWPLQSGPAPSSPTTPPASQGTAAAPPPAPAAAGPSRRLRWRRPAVRASRGVWVRSRLQMAAQMLGCRAAVRACLAAGLPLQLCCRSPEVP